MTLNNLMAMAPVMLVLWGMWSTPSLLLLPGLLWLGVVALDRVLSMGLFDILIEYKTNDLCLTELFEIELLDHSTVCKQMLN